MNLKELIKARKREAIILGGFVAIVVIILAWLWFAAPSTVEVPKAQQHEANANIANTLSVNAETEANTFRDQKVIAHQDTERSKSTLKQRKVQYDKVRKTANSNGVSSADLDARERRLRSDLDKLYP